MQKPSPKQQGRSPVHADSQTLLINSSLFYLLLGGVGALVCFFVHETLVSNFARPEDGSQLLTWLGLGILASGVLIILSYLFEDSFSSYRSLRRFMTHFMGSLPIWFTLYLALISAVAEEILFRGAIQPAIGLLMTSVVFGLMHLGPARAIGAWVLWALIAGLLLGWLYQETQSLWPPVIAHLLVNSYSMLRFRMNYLKLLKDKERRQKAHAMREIENEK